MSLIRERDDSGPPEPLPDERELERRTDELTSSAVMAWVVARYRLTIETVRSYGLGLEHRPTGPWLSIPIRDEASALVNVRRRYVGRKPRLHRTGEKYRNLNGRGEVRLYPADRLPREGSPLVVCCGELDALAFRQATGVAAVTATGGANNWPEGWDDLAQRFGVTVAYDRGEEDYADEIGRRLGARVVHLPPDLPPGTDLADLYRLRGAAALRALVAPRRVVRRRRST